MDGRHKLLHFLIASTLSLLPILCSAHPGGIQSTARDACGVSSYYRDDVGQCVGLQEGDQPHNHSVYQEVFLDFNQQHMKEAAIVISRIIGFEEGFRAHPYICSAGYVTVGLGTKLHKDKGLNPSDFTITVTREVAFLMLEREVNHVTNLIRAGKHAETFDAQPRPVQHIILSMGYQMGYTGLLGFRNMWRALENHNYKWAADEALDSKWARSDSPKRANRHAEVIRLRNMSPYVGLIEGVL